jgi:hypothetical protein
VARRFIGQKELAFIARVNRELIQRVVGQEITYYQVLAEQTQTNDLYNEAVHKAYAQPVRVNCLVYYENTQEVVTNFPPDMKFKIDVFFHNAELVDRNLVPKMGDFVQFGEVLYEIYQATQPQLVFGQIDQKVMTRCTCGPARQGQVGLVKQPVPTPTRDPLAPRYSAQPVDRQLRTGERLGAGAAQTTFPFSFPIDLL